MPQSTLNGSHLTAEDKLDKIRQQIQDQKFQEYDTIRQFINRYVATSPDQVSAKSQTVVAELVGNIHTALGLAPTAQPGVTTVIADQVKDLVFGRAQASEDTARWAVHHAANQVTMYSGQFVYGAEDIFIDGAGMDFVFRRTYKNQGFYNGPLGVNWDHNYNLRLRVLDGGQSIARLTGGFQESLYVKHALYGQANYNYWVPSPGEHSIIVAVAHLGEFDVQPLADCPYVLRTAHGTLHYFEKDPNFQERYRIKRMQDRHGNYLAFSYKSEMGLAEEVLTKIEINCQHRYVDFEKYDEQGRIVQIRDHIKRRWRYAYDDFGDLVTFTTPDTGTYPQGLTEQYTYSSASYTGELQHNLIQVYDTAGRLSLENEYGTDTGLLSFNRVIRQREGHGERFFEYEDVSLATGVPVGQPELEEDWPAHQTIMVRRNGHPVHYIYNKFGNLIAREEDAWASGVRRRLVTHYRYNRDGALIGEISPEGRVTQYLYGRDRFMAQPGIGNPTEEEVRKHDKLTWKERLRFGNRLAVVQRGQRQMGILSFQFPNPLSTLGATNPTQDIIVKFTYDSDEAIPPQSPYQNIKSVSDPRYTNSPLAGGQEHTQHATTRTTFEYDITNKFLKAIQYPDVTRDQLIDIMEQFLDYDAKGRLLEYEDRAGIRLNLVYFPSLLDPNDPEAPKEGYLSTQTIDPNGLNLRTEYLVNAVGVVTNITTPKDQVIGFEVDNLNRVTQVTRTLKPGVDYHTRYTYCRNMRVERIERDVQNDAGQPVWGGTEVQFFHYDENDNVTRQQLGSPNFQDHFVTRYTYDDGDLRVSTILPKGNRIHLHYDERRLPDMITRGAGSEEAATVKIFYDGDGLLVEQHDGRGLKTTFEYDSFGRVIATKEYDEHHTLYRLIRHDYDKAGNLTIERLFTPDGPITYKLFYHASYLYNELHQRIEVRVRRFQTPIVYSLANVEKHEDDVPLAEYDSLGRVIATAVRTLYFYDKAGRLTRVEQGGKRLDSSGNPEPHDTILATTYTYNSVGWLASETDPLGHTTEMRYDNHGLVTRVDVREYVADAPKIEEIFTTLYTYDGLDRLTLITDGLGNVTQFGYDSRDAVIRQRDPLGNVTRFEYDLYGRQVAERIEMTDTGLGDGPRQPDSDVVTQFVYDANGSLICLIDAHGTPTNQSYDALDRRIALTYADGTATTYRYDGNDNLVWVQDNNGLIKCTSYDPLDNPIEMKVYEHALKPNIVIEGADREYFAYNALGQMTCARAEDTDDNWSCDIYFKPDSLGRVYEESVKFSDLAQTFILKRQYDDFGFLRRLTYPSGRVILYHPDKLSRIQRVDNQAYGADYPGHTNLPPQRMLLENQYRGLRMGRKLYGNGASTTYSYDKARRVIEIAHSSAQNTNMLTLQHLYDAVGNMRFKYEYASGQQDYGEVYKYDSRYQLTHYQPIVPPNPLNLTPLTPTQVVPPDHPQFTGQAQINNHLGNLAQIPNAFTFKYDKLGNSLEERQPNQQPILCAVNTLNQIIQRDQVTYTYDLNGNLREEYGSAIRHYIYSCHNQLSRAVEGGVNLARFRHDALGRHVWSWGGAVETFYIYDQENVVEEYIRHSPWQLAQLDGQYVNEHEIDSHCLLAANGVECWYHKDLVGTSRTLTDSTGGVTHYRFTPFGLWQAVGQPHLLFTSYQYAGKRRILQLESYAFRLRHYLPQLGRFCQRDSLMTRDTPIAVSLTLSAGVPDGQVPSLTRSVSTNLYLYARNNPLVIVDPLGLQEQPRVTLSLHEKLAEVRKVEFEATLRRIISGYTGGYYRYSSWKPPGKLLGGPSLPPLEHILLRGRVMQGTPYIGRMISLTTEPSLTGSSIRTPEVFGDPAHEPEVMTQAGAIGVAAELITRAFGWLSTHTHRPQHVQSRIEANVRAVEAARGFFSSTLLPGTEWRGYEIYQLPQGLEPKDIYEPGWFRGFATEAQAVEIQRISGKGDIYYRIIPVSIFGPQTFELPVQPPITRYPEIGPARK
jgi:RHS repeat-associated protein